MKVKKKNWAESIVKNIFWWGIFLGRKPAVWTMCDNDDEKDTEKCIREEKSEWNIKKLEKNWRTKTYNSRSDRTRLCLRKKYTRNDFDLRMSFYPFNFGVHFHFSLFWIRQLTRCPRRRIKFCYSSFSISIK